MSHTGSLATNPADIPLQGAVVIAAVLVTSFGTFLALRQVRAYFPDPWWLPGPWLKAKWSSWQPSPARKRHQKSVDRSVSQEPASPSVGRSMMDRLRPRTERSNLNQATIVDRHTSVRSIATLPAYSSDARDSEQVLGREGERAGVDTVVELPEREEEEEARRNDEMESLYQIRLQRRQEREAREERRRLREEARARNDQATLDELRRASRRHRENREASGSEAMLREHRAKDRKGRAPSVNYWDVGLARHDGSRVRANSNDSTQAPLLNSAASMAGVSDSRPGTRMHDRNLSTTSLRLGLSAELSDDDGASDFEMVTPWTSSRRPSTSATSQNPADGDLGAARLPGVEPPQYEDLGWPHQVPEEEAPAYQSPTSGHAPTSAINRLPSLSLPTINITPFSPTTSPREDRNPATHL